MNTTFPFYTSTAQQDANRVNTPVARICPRHRLLPFQIEVPTGGHAVTSIDLVDCDGNTTSLLTGYFQSVGTTTGASSIGIKEFTNNDYIIYEGGPLETGLPYGVYYLQLDNGYGTYYSEHFSVRNLQPDIFTSSSWGNLSYSTFVESGKSVLTASCGAPGALAVTNSFSFHIGEKINFVCELSVSTGQYPYVAIKNSSNTYFYSDIVQLEEGLNDITLTTIRSYDGDTSVPADVALLYIYNTGASTWSMPWSRIHRTFGSFVKLEFSNTDDLRHSKRDQILYATGGFKQRVYFDTRLNNPASEPIEVGEELDGVFRAEQINATYLYNIVDYVSRSMFRGLQYLPMHDTITITDEVGNEYTPDVGNVDVSIDWTTFDTGTLRIEFNDGAMDWVNDQSPIT